MSIDIKSTVFSFATQRTPQEATKNVTDLNIFHPNILDTENYFSSLFTSPDADFKKQKTKCCVISR